MKEKVASIIEILKARYPDALCASITARTMS